MTLLRLVERELSTSVCVEGYDIGCFQSVCLLRHHAFLLWEPHPWSEDSFDLPLPYHGCSLFSHIKEQ